MLSSALTDVIDPAQLCIESHLLSTNHSKGKSDENERDGIEASSFRINSRRSR